MSPLDLERFFWDWWLSELRNAAERGEMDNDDGDEKSEGDRPDFQEVSISADDRTKYPEFREFCDKQSKNMLAGASP